MLSNEIKAGVRVTNNTRPQHDRTLFARARVCVIYIKIASEPCVLKSVTAAQKCGATRSDATHSQLFNEHESAPARIVTR